MRAIAVLVILVALAFIAPVAFGETFNMSFTSKTFNVASSGQSPYFYGIATNNTSVMFATPGKGEQRATLDWLNRIPLNTTVRVTYTDYVISDVTLLS